MLNIHERIIDMDAHMAFQYLEDMGTAKDLVWPNPDLPFERTPGELRPGVTTESHGRIRATLQDYTSGSRIAWGVDMAALKGSHVFLVEAIAPGKSKVKHVLEVDLAPWFVPLWDAEIGPLHDKILEGLLDKMQQLASEHGGMTAEHGASTA